MTITDAAKAGGAATLLVLAGLLARGLTSPGPGAQAGHIVVATPEGQPTEGRVAVLATVLADLQAQALFGFDGGLVTTTTATGVVTTTPAHPQVYARARVCVVPVDGGADPGASLLGGHLQVVFDDPTVEACAADAPALEAWVQGHPAAPWACRCCATGIPCTVAHHALDGTVTWGPGVPGLTYPRADVATDAGSVGKPCIELSGQPSMPEVCTP